MALPNVFGLLRSPTQPAQGDSPKAKLVLGDIYLIMERELLDKTLASKVPPERFHAYLGLCLLGTEGQLENELKHGFWYIFNGRTDLVFDGDPDTLWGRHDRVDRPPDRPRHPSLASLIAR